MAKTKAQQDDAAGPHTRFQRQAQNAVDKIVSSAEPPHARMRELERIRKYAVTMLHRLAIEGERGEDAT